MLSILKFMAALVICGQVGTGLPAEAAAVDNSGSIAPEPVPALASAAWAEEPARVHFIDVGQADAIYIQLPYDYDILIDAGDVSDGSVVVNYLHGQGMDGEIDLLIATHPHRDHIGGIPDVMEAFSVVQVIDSGLAANTRIYESYKESVLAEGCAWAADDYLVYKFGEYQLTILTGNETWREVNNYSVVARLDCGEIEFLFMGDGERDLEDILAGDISAEILKVGHHGSRFSSSAEFLARVRPEAAIISVGGGNRYGHPHEETVARLEGLGVRVYRTDIEGSRVIETDGRQMAVWATAFYHSCLAY